MTTGFTVSGNIVDVVAGEVFPGKITVEDGRISQIERLSGRTFSNYISPGLVDAHVHVESSLVTPVEFGRAACVHGTVASVSDPHEIANVLGVEGVEWMLENARHTPFKIYFGCPSCVPATSFETAGAVFGEKEISQLLDKKEIKYLSEVMNFPGVIHGDKNMLRFIEMARERGKRVDGHAPGVLDDDLDKYISTGVETDHECSTLEEGRQRCRRGMKVAIREGSAARNFDALWPLLSEFPESVFLCSDDKHPDDLIKGHINTLVARALSKGCDFISVLRAATLNPVRHYGLEVGLLQVGDQADLVEWTDERSFIPVRVWIDGQLVAAEGQSRLSSVFSTAVNNFYATKKRPEDFAFKDSQTKRRVIVALDGEILTEEATEETSGIDIERDLLKIAVVNRYEDRPPAVALIKNFGLKSGALASSVAHDSHNIVVVGTSDESICRAVNLVIENRGGLSAVGDGEEAVLPLPVAGLMCNNPVEEVAKSFSRLNEVAYKLGSRLNSPFMTLSFMALLVIPSLKLSDLGLFDVNRFSLIGVDD